MSSKKSIQDYLTVLGINPVEQEIFLTICELGNQPASTIARKVWIERTKAYRHLENLTKQGLISTSQQHGPKTFFVSDLSGLESLREQKQRDLSYLTHEKSWVFQAIHSLTGSDLSLPDVRIFEGDQIAHLFRDMTAIVEAKKLKMIRFFASNSYEEQTRSKTLQQPVKDFFKEMKSKKITLESYIGTGSLIMERIEKEADISILESLPSTDSSTHVFVVGTIVYIIIYKDKPIGIRLDSKHFAHVLHLLLDNVVTSKSGNS